MDELKQDKALVRLCNDNLADLPDHVARPSYDRALLTPGILQIGVGNFHRAHQAWYLHRLLEKGINFDWAIIGAGVRPYDARQRQKLAEQDYLTTLIALDPRGSSAEVIGSMIDYVPVSEDNAPLIARMVCAEIRIVSLTITEGGYYLDPVTMQFDTGHPDIQYDAMHPAAPKTAFGAMVAALKLRRANGLEPFTGLCCDNLQSNGTKLRQAVVSLAELSDPDLAQWIDDHCSFPNSMVDCIVPATGPREIALASKFGVDDTLPVTHENFRQWVIEDDFCAGRPNWDEVGATFCCDVDRFEAMKIRILNGGHQVIANLGELLSLQTIADCMAHPKLGAFFRKVLLDEVAPHVDPVPGMRPDAYVALVESRFRNPKIIDTTRRVAFDGSSRHPGFVIPTIREGLRKGMQISGLALVEAAWARMCAGTREDGSDIAPNDPNWHDLKNTAQEARHAPLAWLGQSQYYGDLAQSASFEREFCRWLKMIWADGAEAVIDNYLRE